MENKKTILITRDLPGRSAFFPWAQKNRFGLIHRPFIAFTPIASLAIPETDWIFFSSPASVKLYDENYVLKAKKIAALSNGTADALEKRGIQQHFVGDNKKSPAEIGKEFLTQVPTNQSILFPLSDISKKNVSSQFTTHKIIELVTYETKLASKRIEVPLNIIVFTSPSNVCGFLAKNRVNESTNVVAIGKTTEKELNDFGIENVHLPASTDEQDVVSLLSKLV
jgi:uroporphyrinogen-III synthase